MKPSRILLILVLAALTNWAATASALAAPDPRAALPAPTAPCYAAAMAALTKPGAIYSQGGALPNDPINPATGTYYPRTGPNSFDCSGLVWWAYAQAGVTVGESTYQQLNNGVALNCTLADLHGSATTCWTLGDLVFLRYTGGQHVAIYVGSGLFMDCYNHATGCILHDVTTDSFYAAHFYEARRVVSGCEGMTHNPGQPTANPPDAPTLEVIPDLLAPLWFVVPQCNTCGGPGAGLAHDPPPNFLDDPILYPFKWLATAIKNTIIDLICWLLGLLQMLVNIICSVANTFIDGINAFWKMLILVYFNVRAAIYSFWSYLGSLVGLLSDLSALGSIALTYLQQILAILESIIALVGSFILVLITLFTILIGIVGWIGAIVISLFADLLLALKGTALPIEIGADHLVYHMVRGTLEGLQASQIGWLFYLAYAFIYIGFVLWFARFIASVNKD